MSADHDRIAPGDEELAAASAALDWEGPAPVDPSPETSRFVDDAMRLRRTARIAAVAPMPDLVAGTLRRLDEPDVRPRRWRPSTVAAVAAAFVIGVVAAGLFSLNRDLESPTVVAAEIGTRARHAAVAVSRIDAHVTVVERGAHPDVPVRRYEGDLQYRAPERMRLSLRESTALPSGWPANDLEIVVDENRAWRSRRLACPVDGLPDCLGPRAVDGIDHRSPFSAGWAAPLDLVVPLGALDAAVDVFDDGDVLVATTSVARGRELIATTIDNGAFRQVHADDELEVRVDAATLELRGFRVRAAATEARRLWAATWGYDDAAGDELIRLDIAAAEPVPFDVRAPTATFGSGGFVDGPTSVETLLPVPPEGFEAHRSGESTAVGAAPVEIASWADGRSWLSIRATTAGTRIPPASEVRSVDGRPVISDEIAHEVIVLTETRRVTVAGSLPFEELLSIAAGLPLDRVTAAPVADAAATTTVIDGVPVLIELRPGRELPPATKGDIISVAVRGTRARHSPTLGTLSWVERGTVVTVSADADLDTLLAAAEEVRIP